MYNDFFKSNNNDYIGTIEPVGDDIVNINIISSLTRNILYCVTLPGSFGGERFSVSDDGDLVASAVYSDYGKGKVSIYSNKEKKVIFETALFKRIDWIDFYNLSVLMIGEKNKTHIYNFVDDICGTQNDYRVFSNLFNGDIILHKENVLLINGKKIKSKTFSFFNPVGVTDGVIISEIGGAVLKYSYEGNKEWELNIEKYGHALKIYYFESKNILILDVFDYLKGGSTFMIVDNETGKILKLNRFESNNYIFIPQGNGYIIDYKSNVYYIDENYNWVFSHELKNGES